MASKKFLYNLSTRFVNVPLALELICFFLHIHIHFISIANIQSNQVQQNLIMQREKEKIGEMLNNFD